MSDMDFLERQALERLAHINSNTYKAGRNSAKPSESAKIKQKVTSMPVEFPEGYSYPNFETTFRKEQENRARQENQAKQIKQTEKKENSGSNNALSELLHDPEAALLTGLIMLLQSEGADEVLLAALGYILL